MEMLRDIDEDTVDFVAQLRRPHARSRRSCRPRFPNLLVNGSDGHRGRHGHQHPAAQPARGRRRPCSGAWSNPDADEASTLDALIELVKGPDFPTGGADRRPATAIEDAYRTGRGSIRMRAVVEVEEDARGPHHPGRHRAAVPGQPGQPRRAHRRAGQGGQARRHRRHPRRVLRPHRHAPGHRAQARRGRQGRAEQPLQAHPAAGDLRRQHAGAGRRRAAHAATWTSSSGYYVAHQIEVIVRRTAYRLRKAEERAHILRGLVKALDLLDEVIALIRRSPSGGGRPRAA